MKENVILSPLPLSFKYYRFMARGSNHQTNGYLFKNHDTSPRQIYLPLNSTGTCQRPVCASSVLGWVLRLIRLCGHTQAYGWKRERKMRSRINRHPAELKCKLSFKTHMSFKGLNKEAWTRASQDLSEELLPCREWGQSRNVKWTPCTQQSETKAHLLLPWWPSFHEMEITWSCNKGD